MIDWYNELAFFPKIYWTAAIIGSLFLIITLILSFIGSDTGDIGDVDAEIEADTGIGFQFLTLKNTVGFFTIFGWVGLSCIGAGMSNWLTILISVISGLVMMVVMAALYYYMKKLNASGTLDYKNAINTVGEVYLTVGAKRSATGKVQVQVQGALRDLEALTDAETELKSGTVVIVKDVTPNGILIIDKLNQ